MKTKVYLAGGMKSDWRDWVKNGCDDGLTFISPSNHLLEDPKQYTFWDLQAIKSCDLLFGMMGVENPSGLGLSLEIGFAKGLGKTIILCDLKSDDDVEFKRRFEIVRNSADVLFENMIDAIDFLNSFTRM